MSSLVTNLNSSIAQEIVNWVTTADGCVHTADATRLRCWQICLDSTRRDCRQLVANCVGLHAANATQLDSRVASAVCRPIGHDS